MHGQNQPCRQAIANRQTNSITTRLVDEEEWGKKKKTVLLSAPENTCPSIPAKKNRLAERVYRHPGGHNREALAVFFRFAENRKLLFPMGGQPVKKG